MRAAVVLSVGLHLAVADQAAAVRATLEELSLLVAVVVRRNLVVQVS
jgi:hypothetical protein